MFNKHNVKRYIASGCHTGLIPFIPGTLAAVVGVLIYAVIVCLFNETRHIVTVLAVVIAILMTATHDLYEFAKKEWGSHDAKEFVLDEIIGFLSTVFFIHCVAGLFNLERDGFYKFKIIIPSFVLFRLFDIIKIYPANIIDNDEGPDAVIFDDVVSAAWAAFVVIIFL